jgi:hypothetical protein
MTTVCRLMPALDYLHLIRMQSDIMDSGDAAGATSMNRVAEWLFANLAQTRARGRLSMCKRMADSTNHARSGDRQRTSASS